MVVSHDVPLGHAAAAGAVGLINSMGNLGGFVGPYLTGWVRQTTGSFAGAMLYLAMSLAAAGLLILTLERRPPDARVARGPQTSLKRTTPETPTTRLA